VVTSEIEWSSRSEFAVPEDVAYFNTANLAPLLHTVRAAGEAALASRGMPWTISPADWFTDVERLRTQVGALLGDDADGVALVPSTSYGMATAADNLPLVPGSAIVVLAEEYPSGVYTWRRHAERRGATVVTVTPEPGQDWTSSILSTMDLLGERVGIVSVPQVHWTDGSWVDLDTVGTRARELGAALVIDASQSLGAVPMDVRALRPDFVVSVGYKWLLGPFGRGYLWVAPTHRDGTPLEENWIVRAGSEDFARLVDYRDAYQPGARRFDQGQRTAFELTPMAVAATAQLLAWGVPRVAAHLARITGIVLDRATALGLEAPRRPRGPHMLGLPLPAGSGDRVTAALAERGCYAAVRGNSLRIAPHLHITEHDIDTLTDALGTALG